MRGGSGPKADRRGPRQGGNGHRGFAFEPGRDFKMTCQREARRAGRRSSEGPAEDDGDPDRMRRRPAPTGLPAMTF